MKKVVYKYPIQDTTAQPLELPIGAQILSAAMQGAIPHIWCLVPFGEKNTEIVHIRLLCTGEPFEETMGRTMTFIDTIHTSQGYVFHLFREQ